ncbi:hypothetical protein AKO1_008224 [Acrasis kona]|uniref:Uncharacterized protein n=1 Tax=Acrasis kona TaxID=1008807 RepID=A0AAW2YLF5_9EUKA
MTNVAFLGLGVMGMFMAEHLVDNKYIVHAFNRTTEKSNALKKKKGDNVIVASTVLDAVEKADKYVVAMMFDYDNLKNNIFNDPMVMKAMASKSLIMMMTIGVEYSLEANEICSKNNIKYYECPVLGTNTVAQAGKLQLLLGAEEGDKELEALLHCFGPTIRYLDSCPKAMQIKLALNNLVIGLTSVYGTSLAMVERAGIEPDLLHDIVKGGQFHFGYMDLKGPRFLERNYKNPNFSVDGVLKDVSLIEEEAKRLGVGTSVLAGVKDLAKETVEKGPSSGGDDFAEIYEILNPK